MPVCNPSLAQARRGRQGRMQEGACGPLQAGSCAVQIELAQLGSAALLRWPCMLLSRRRQQRVPVCNWAVLEVLLRVGILPPLRDLDANNHKGM